MMKAPGFPRQARWAVPFGAVAVVGVVAAGSVLASAQAAPALPARTPAQLVAAIAANKSALPPLSGVIASDASLGLPDLPATAGPAAIPSLLAGSHTTEIWYASPAQFRLAVPVPLGETDLRADGRQVWLWDSKTDTATHIKLPPGPATAATGSEGSFYSGGSFYSASKTRTSTAAASSATSGPAAVFSAAASFHAAPTPQDVARALLAMLGPTTTVGVQSNVMVAGQPAYQLVLAPKNPGSLIGRVSIAIDASRYLPLRVQVFARGAASPAYQVGFTSISFARPAASNFTFTPPPGAKVKTVTVPAGFGLAGPLGALSGSNGGGFLAVPKGTATYQGGQPTSSISVAPGLPTGNNAKRRAGDGMAAGTVTTHPLQGAIDGMKTVDGVRKGLPKNLSKSQRQHLMKVISRGMARAGREPGWHGAGWYAYAPTTGGTFPLGAASAPRVIGSGWLAVTVLPAAGLTNGPPGPAGSPGGEASALLRTFTPVHGSWGSGRLLRTSLLSVLITSNGKALIGAVTPSVLYAAAAQAK
jgi:outer membrane lipoprotein-sorting protein